jgi:hypothetical protein
MIDVDAIVAVRTLFAGVEVDAVVVACAMSAVLYTIHGKEQALVTETAPVHVCY